MPISRKDELKAKRSLLKKLRAKLSGETISTNIKSSPQEQSGQELIDMLKENEVIYKGLVAHIANNLTGNFTLFSSNETIKLSKSYEQSLTKIKNFIEKNKDDIKKNYYKTDLSTIKKYIRSLKSQDDIYNRFKGIIDEFKIRHRVAIEANTLNNDLKKTYTFHQYVEYLINDVEKLIEEINI